MRPVRVGGNQDAIFIHRRLKDDVVRRAPWMQGADMRCVVPFLREPLGHLW